LELPHGALLSVSSTKVLTIDGTVSRGLWQYFTGAGTVTIGGKNSVVHPELWGAVADGSPMITRPFTPYL
jgi:hypothetical protein